MATSKLGHGGRRVQVEAALLWTVTRSDTGNTFLPFSLGTRSRTTEMFFPAKELYIKI